MKIIKIDNIYNMEMEFPEDDYSVYRSHYDGFRITTDEKIILLLIDSDQRCCENFGHICSNGKFSEFIGSEILSYKAVDNVNYNEIPLLKNLSQSWNDCVDCAFVNFETDKGTLQFVVYNSHNGYYGHDIKILELTYTIYLTKA